MTDETMALRGLMEKSDTPLETPASIVRLRQPDARDDPLTEVLRAGARRLPSGPERAIQMGIGPAPVTRVRVRDRRAAGSEDRIRFSSSILPRWARHRTVRTKGALSPITAKRMVFRPVMAASKTWRRLKGESQLPKIVAGVIFRDGTEVTASPDHRAA